MSLLFNMLSRLVTAFLPRSKRLLISCCNHHLQWFLSPGSLSHLSFFFKQNNFGGYTAQLACGILPGIKPVPPAVGTQSPKLWTAREVPQISNSSLILEQGPPCILTFLGEHTLFFECEEGRRVLI